MKNETSQWDKEIGNLDKDQVRSLSLSIKKSIEIGISKSEEEYANFLNSTPDLIEFHKRIIEWKTEFLKLKSSDYSILNKYTNDFERKLDGTDSDKTAKVALLFFVIFKKGIFSDFTDFERKFSLEVQEFTKAKILYDCCSKIIDISNKDVSHDIKLPLIENFEIDSFRWLNDLKNEKDKSSKEMLDLSEETYNSLISKNNALLLNEQKSKEFLYDEINILKRNVSDLELEKKSALIQNEYLKDQNTSLVNYNLKREPTIVYQFEDTVWGDNYPALKLLYDFLFNYYDINFNWSYFTSMMTLKSKEVINLNLIKITKGETGYLLFKLKEFFVNPVSMSYSTWLSQKITIKGGKIDSSFFNVRIRNTSASLPNQDNVKLIEKLTKDITNRYNKA